MTAINATINGSIIREQAKVLSQQMNTSDFECSCGWLNRFTKRQWISQYIKSGETAGVDENIVLWT